MILRQPPLPLTVATTTALVTVETARAALGVDEDSILAKIELGRIRWAWDIAIRRGQIREVRIWGRCLTALQHELPQPGDSLPDVVREVAGTGERLRASEVRALLMCSQQHVQRLVAIGALRADVARGTRWVDRQSLSQFLSARVIT